MSRSRLIASALIAFTLSGAAAVAAVTTFPITSGAVQKTRVYKPGNGVTLPVVVREFKPSYTAAAMQQRIQGSVWLQVVVLETGDIGEVQVSRSLDTEYGLDAEAIKATKQWKFKPGMKDGKPVAVEVTIELTFTLKK